MLIYVRNRIVTFYVNHLTFYVNLLGRFNRLEFMKRRTEIKLNKAKMFSRKYIFSSRFIVRNSLVLLLAGSITAGGIFTIKNLPDYSEKQIVLGSTSINAALEQADEAVVTDIVADGFEINSTSTMVIKDDSIDVLRSHLEDEESFDLAVGDAKNLTNSKYDMKGKFISTKKKSTVQPLWSV